MQRSEKRTQASDLTESEEEAHGDREKVLYLRPGTTHQPIKSLRTRHDFKRSGSPVVTVWRNHAENHRLELLEMDLGKADRVKGTTRW